MMNSVKNARSLHLREQGATRWFNFIIVLLGLLLSASSVSQAQPLAQGLDKFLGCATGSEIWRYLNNYWNQVTPGNDGKWGSVEWSRGVYNWTNLDKIYRYATTRNLPYKHHTLIWGQQQPGWIDGLSIPDQRKAIEDWIKAVGERYPAMAYVDVVNEPLRAPASYKAALGGDGATGWDWVITSFQLARQYCAPGVKLLVNEYNILSDNQVTSNYIALINLLKDRGLIDGIGIQGHYFEFRSDMNAANPYVYSIATLKANLDRLGALGLPIYITEFDIDEPNDENQLAQYKIYFPLFWSHPAVQGITLWGYIQGDVWNSHPNTYLLLANGAERPALKWLRTFLVSPPVPVTISPAGSTGGIRNPLFVWRTSKTAISYRFQIATTNQFTSPEIDTTVTDTLLYVPPLETNKRYFWRVNASNDKGTSEFSAAVGFMTGELINAVAARPGMPVAFTLAQNYPNPFNPGTNITFSLAHDGMVELTVYDMLGCRIATLVNAKMAAGEHIIPFDGSRLQSGSYFYTLRIAGKQQTRKMLLIK